MPVMFLLLLGEPDGTAVEVEEGDDNGEEGGDENADNEADLDVCVLVWIVRELPLPNSSLVSATGLSTETERTQPQTAENRNKMRARPVAVGEGPRAKTLLRHGDPNMMLG